MQFALVKAAPINILIITTETETKCWSADDPQKEEEAEKTRGDGSSTGRGVKIGGWKMLVQTDCTPAVVTAVSRGRVGWTGLVN